MRYNDRKQQIQNYIETYTAKHCSPPTVREIQARLGIKSTATVYADLRSLMADGVVRQAGTRFAPTYTESYKAKLRKYLR